MRVAVATGAGMLFAVGMNAAFELCILLTVACGALHLRGMVGMRVVLDVGVAVVAFETTVDARRKLWTIDTDAVAAAVFHRQVAVASEAVGLRAQWMREQKDENREKSGNCEAVVRAEGMDQARKDEVRRPHISAACGLGHSAVIFLRNRKNPRVTQGSSLRPASRTGRAPGWNTTFEENLLGGRAAVTHITNAWLVGHRIEETSAMGVTRLICGTGLGVSQSTGEVELGWGLLGLRRSSDGSRPKKWVIGSTRGNGRG